MAVRRQQFAIADHHTRDFGSPIDGALLLVIAQAVEAGLLLQAVGARRADRLLLFALTVAHWVTVGVLPSSEMEGRIQAKTQQRQLSPDPDATAKHSTIQDPEYYRPASDFSPGDCAARRTHRLKP